MHDPNINQEFQRRLSEQIGLTLSPDSRMKKLSTIQSQKFNQNLFNINLEAFQPRQSKQSLRTVGRDASHHSQHHANSNVGQQDSASKQSKIPSQKMQDYQTKPLKR